LCLSASLKIDSFKEFSVRSNRIQIIYLFILVVSGFECKVLGLLGKCFVSEPCPQPFFTSVIFQVESSPFCQGCPWTVNLLNSWDSIICNLHNLYNL
jgi:hypothetical protein